MSDVFDTGQGIIVAVPVTAREKAAGQWGVISDRITTGPAEYPPEPGIPSWPPESDSQWQQYETVDTGGGSTYTFASDGKHSTLFYVIDKNENASMDAERFDNRTGQAEAIVYFDHLGGASIESNYTDWYNPNNADPNGEYVRRHTYENAIMWCQYDLSGIDWNSVESAEVCIVLSAYWENNPIPATDGSYRNYNAVAKDILFQFVDLSGDYNGHPFDPNDFQSLSGASACPVINTHQIRDWAASAEQHPYWDNLQPSEAHWFYVLPVNDAGMAALRASGGIVGLAIGFDAVDDPDYGIGIDVIVPNEPNIYTLNNLCDIGFSYDDWDSYPTWYNDPADESIFERAAALPNLRLWIGGRGVRLAGSATMSIDAVGRIQPPAEPGINHRARLIRDQS